MKDIWDLYKNSGMLDILNDIWGWIMNHGVISLIFSVLLSWFWAYITTDKVKNWTDKKIFRINDEKLFTEFQKYLDNRNFKHLENLPKKISRKNTLIIWPIKIQTRPTYIHIAQIQLIKQLLLVDRKLKLFTVIGDFINNCDADKSNYDTEKFKKDIWWALRNNGINKHKITIMPLSSLYSGKGKRIIKVYELLNNFKSIAKISWIDYRRIIEYKYETNKKRKVKERPISNNIQPLLKWSLIYTISHKYNVIVVVGEDEHHQWSQLQKNMDAKNIGFIYIPALKDKNANMDQAKITINSPDDMMRKINDGNMAEWLYLHFVEIPKFEQLVKCGFFKKSCTEDAKDDIREKVRQNYCGLSQDLCKKNEGNCIICLFGNNSTNFNTDEFHKDKFVEHVYSKANPANT